MPKRRRSWLRAAVLGAIALGAWPIPGGAVPADPVAPAPPAAGRDRPAPSTAAPVVGPEIQPLLLPEDPAPGKGRMTLAFGGNRRWCTYPDDRMVRPRVEKGPRTRRNEIITFGYKFSVSAIKRGAPAAPIMLFESPTIRTASWRPASKVGVMTRKSPVGPGSGGQTTLGKTPQGQEGPTTLVPYWQEQYRCTTLPERFDFDLDPGTYDVYIAFDLLDQQGSWSHRSTAFLTDVTVEGGRRTRLDGLVNLAAGGERQVELQSATLVTETKGGGAGDP
jgi:hypothetical protein